MAPVLAQHRDDPRRTRSSHAPRRHLVLGGICGLLTGALPYLSSPPASQASPPASITILHTIKVGDNPGAVAVATRSRRAFVINQGSRLGSTRRSVTVSVLNADSGAILRTVDLGTISDPAQPTLAPAMAVNERTGRIFVLLNGRNTTHPTTSASSGGWISILDATTGALLHTTRVGETARAVTVDEQTGRVFVANAGSNSVSILDGATGLPLRTVPVSGSPSTLAVDTRLGLTYVGTLVGGISTLNATTGAVLTTTTPLAGPGHGTDPVSAGPGTVCGVAVDEQAGRVIVSLAVNRYYSRVSTLNAVTGAVEMTTAYLRAVADCPGQLVGVDAKRGHAIILTGAVRDCQSDCSSSAVVLATQSGRVVHSVPITGGNVVVVDTTRGRAFVTTGMVALPGIGVGANTVSVLDTDTGDVMGTGATGPGPQALAVDGRTGYVFVATTQEGTVRVLTVRPPAHVALGAEPRTAPATPACCGSLFFPQTHHNLGGPFLAFYRKYGGLDTFGYPRTEPFTETGHLVQYTDRFGLELVDGQVWTAPLGRLLTARRTFTRVATVPSTSTLLYFARTGHSLSGRFLAYWRNHAGAILLGAPIAEATTETNGDGTGRLYRVQWCENGRMEYHPELAHTRYEVELGLVGKQTLQQGGWLP